jgi:hypothetical protein
MLFFSNIANFIKPIITLIAVIFIFYGAYIAFIQKNKIKNRYKNISKIDILNLNQGELLDLATEYAYDKFSYDLQDGNRNEISYLKSAKKERRVIWTTAMLDFTYMGSLENLFLMTDPKIIFMLEKDLKEMNEINFSKELSLLLDKFRDLSLSEIREVFEDSKLEDINKKFFTKEFEDQFNKKRIDYIKNNLDHIFLLNKRGKLDFKK